MESWGVIPRVSPSGVPAGGVQAGRGLPVLGGPHVSLACH